MNGFRPVRKSGSLLERASELYQLSPMAPPKIELEKTPQILNSDNSPVRAAPRTAPVRQAYHGPTLAVDRAKLVAGGYIVPGESVSGISEEFRIVKRQLLLAARGNQKYAPVPQGERILICSAHPNEGKTFCALNLALSMATEKDNEVLLVDADFAKPSVLNRLGWADAPGLMDALADDQIDVEELVIHSDIPGLAVLPAGGRTNQDTEYLAAARTAHVLDQLTANNPARVIIFDSPPALSASPASVLATLVGQVVVVVRADVTTETALRDALNLLGGCDHIQLLLNSTKFSPTGRSFGSYYAYGDAQ